MTMTNKLHSFNCIIYLADGKHISQNEVCATAKEAIERCEAWRKLGHRADAFVIVIDPATNDVDHFALV